jgi:hypothetical protein
VPASREREREKNVRRPKGSFFSPQNNGSETTPNLHERRRTKGFAFFSLAFRRVQEFFRVWRKKGLLWGGITRARANPAGAPVFLGALFHEENPEVQRKKKARRRASPPRRRRRQNTLLLSTVTFTISRRLLFRVSKTHIERLGRPLSNNEL